jgi:hypothetical protein
MRALCGDEHQPLCARGCVVLAAVIENISWLGKRGCGEKGESEKEFHEGMANDGNPIPSEMMKSVK